VSHREQGTSRRRRDPIEPLEIIQKGRLAGLGFSTVREIVSESGGVVTVDSVPGRGTRVTVYLPVAVGDVVVATPAQRARIRRSGTETVLLIEDDVAVRDRVRRLLEGSG